MTLFRLQATTSMTRLLALGTSWAIGIVLLVSNYYWPFRGGLSYAQFWLGILFCMIPASFLILGNAFSRGSKALVLFVWGVTLYLPKVLRTPEFFINRDELSHFQTLKLIYESGSLNINHTVFKASIYYPGLELLTVSLKSITNLSLFSTGILLIGFIHSLSLVFIFLLFEKITSSTRIAALGAFLYTANTGFTYFGCLFSYESLGIFLVVLLLFLISKGLHEMNSMRILSSLSLIVVSALVITHHFSSYMLLLFLIILILVQFYKNVISKKSIDKKSYLNFALLTATLIFGWLIYVATISIEYLGGILTDRLYNILKFSIFEGQRQLFWQSPLPNYEVFIDTYTYIPLILLFSGLGVYFIIKERKVHNTFIYALIVYGPVLYFLSLSLIPTYSADIAYRSWSFLFIGASFVVAFATDRMIQRKKVKFLSHQPLLKIFSFVAITLIFVGGISISLPEPVRFSAPPKFATGPSSMSFDVFHSADWFQNYFGRYNNIVGDLTIEDAFGAYGIQNARAWLAWEVFFPKIIDNHVLDNLKGFQDKYLITNALMSRYLAESGFYFKQGELHIEEHPGYGRTQPLPKECLDKFDNSIFFNRMYTNGNITIYKINLEKFP